MSEIKILGMFEDSLKDFFYELIEQFPEEGDLVVILCFLKTNVPVVDVMNIFNTYINSNDGELKKMVKERNETFFLKHNLFDVFGKDKVGHFKKLWTSQQMSQDTKDGIWSWIDSFIKLGDAYMKVMSTKSTV